ncbi:MAG: hypothetical protein DRQ78_09955 [Epsilonproteobacteria bacterium]|nr:MAG: hypothetical protein DRQ78_09955 [Campylobacterota bacterium]
MSHFSLFILLSSLIIFSACSSKNIPLENKKISMTKLPKGEIPLQKYLNKTDKVLVGHSAFHSLEHPIDALAARLFIIDHAKSSLDVQYYIYEDDNIGKLFTAHLLLAAKRGVRVRLLLDDLSTAGKDENLQKLALHPNVELRLFNPNKLRTSFRNLALLFNVNSLGKRMHNKSLIADGYAAIIGGRNIGDVYFAATDETLFLDYDVLSIGAVVPDISQAFDIYWNSEQAVPSSEVFGVSKYTYEDISEELSLHLKQKLKVFQKSPFGIAVSRSNFMKKVNHRKLQFIVSEKVDFYYDDPSKVAKDENDNSTHISSQIRKDLTKLKSELTIVSPYFIPSDEMMKRIKTLRKKDVEVTILTNSLSSTDVFPVYAAYQDYIEVLVKMGVHLHELKANSFSKELQDKHFKKTPRLSLHTKMILLDQNRLAIGSANIDPRSDKLNTELFMVITSEKLTKEEQNIIAKVLSLDNTYKLSWGTHPKIFDDDVQQNGPVWTTLEEGKKTIYYERPKTGFWKRLGTDFISIFPIKGYL